MGNLRSMKKIEFTIHFVSTKFCPNNVHPMETGFPIAVAAAAPWRVGGSAMPVAAAPGGELLRLGGGNGVVPSEPCNRPYETGCVHLISAT